MPAVADLPPEDVRDALRVLGETDAVAAAGARRALRDRLSQAGAVADLLERAPEGAATAFRHLVVEGVATVEDLLGRGWAGKGLLPPPLDWLQRRALIAVGPDGMVHPVDEARDSFAAMTLDLQATPPPAAPTQAPFVVEGVRTVVVAPSAAALDRMTPVSGAALRAVSDTVAVSDRPPLAVQAALESAGATVTGPDSVTSESGEGAMALPGMEEDAVGPRAIRQLIQRALAEQRQLRLQYFASSRGGQATERVVDPWVFADDLLRGWCHLRADERAFAVDRIGHARLLTTPVAHHPSQAG